MAAPKLQMNNKNLLQHVKGCFKTIENTQKELPQILHVVTGAIPPVCGACKKPIKERKKYSEI